MKLFVLTFALVTRISKHILQVLRGSERGLQTVVYGQIPALIPVFVLFYFMFGFEAILSYAQGPFLALYSDHFWQCLGEHMRCPGLNPSQSCAKPAGKGTVLFSTSMNKVILKHGHIRSLPGRNRAELSGCDEDNWYVCHSTRSVARRKLLWEILCSC